MTDPAAIAARNIHKKWTAVFTFDEIHQQAMIYAWQRQDTWQSDRHAIRDLHYMLSNWVRTELRARGWKSDRNGKNWRRQEIPVPGYSDRYDWKGLYAPDTEYLRLSFDWPEMSREQWDSFARYILDGHPVVAAEFEALEESSQRRAWKDKRRAVLRAKHASVLGEARLYATYGDEGMEEMIAAA